MLKALVRSAASSRLARGHSPASILVKSLTTAAMKSFEITTKLLGPVLIALAIILISTVTYTWFDSIMPALGFSAFSLPWVLFTSVGIWILLNVIVNYGASILTSPGYVPRNVATSRPLRSPAAAPVDLESGATGDAASPASSTGGTAAAGIGMVSLSSATSAVAPIETGDDVRLVIQPPSASATATDAATGSAGSSSGVALSHTATGGRRRGAGGAAASDNNENVGIDGSGNGDGTGAGGAGAFPDEDDGDDDEGESNERNAADEAAAERAYLDEIVHGDPNRVGHCRKCDGPKPARTHHCHVCGKCVLKMDHHCPWLGNCVGYHNYPYFFKMLFYFWMGCCYVVAVSVFPFIDTLTPPSKRSSHHTASALSLSHASQAASTSGASLDTIGTGGSVDPILAAANAAGFGSETRVTLVFVICLSVGFAVALLFAWHVYLLLTNQTSIEYLTNSSLKYKLRHRGMVYRNPFDLGWKRNWVAVFGNGPWYSFFLPMLYRSAGDGTRYDTNR